MQFQKMTFAQDRSILENQVPRLLPLDPGTMPPLAGFIGSPHTNLLRGEAARTLGAETFGIRPEHLTLSPDHGLWRGRVRHVERLGADAIVHLDAPGAGELVARTSGDAGLAPGAEVGASPLEGAGHRLAA